MLCTIGTSMRRLDRWDRAQLITVEDNPIAKLPTLLIGYCEDLTVEVLKEEGDNGVLGVILLRENDKNGGLLTTELLGIDKMF